MNTILYDHQIFSLQKFGGISRYFYELNQSNSYYENNLSLIYTPNQYLLNESNNKYKKFEIPEVFKNSIQKIVSKTKRRFYKINNQYHTIKSLKNQNFNIFHPTYYNPYFLKYICKKPWVLTVYDMIDEKLNLNFNGNSFINNKKKLIHLAHKIIAISQNTKNDIIDLYGIDDKKIEVIHLANSLQPYVKNTKPNFPYILFVGNRNLYKNFDILLKAIHIIFKKYPELHLICTGPAFNDIEKKKFLSLNISERIHHQFTNDDNLWQLYHQAEIFVFPSQYEGFGIPILEAFSAGCPVVLSNASCFPEIAKDAAAFFENDCLDGLVHILQTLISNSDMREHLKVKGLERLKNFSWDKTRQQHAEIYLKALI